MFTKNILLLFFLMLNMSVFSQTRTSLECVDREFSVVVHVVNTNIPTPILSSSEINQYIDSLNTIWNPICIKFNLCDIRQVYNYNFLDWDKDTMEKEFLAINYEPRVINIIVVSSLYNPAGYTGYATLGGIAKRNQPYILVEAGGELITWIHELGHYFGLLHTFEQPLGLADNSDCATTGDLLCDTYADPYSNVSNCVYQGNTKDINGKFYNPLIENYMSYYGLCRKSFTHQQYEKMIATYKLDKEAHF